MRRLVAQAGGVLFFGPRWLQTDQRVSVAGDGWRAWAADRFPGRRLLPAVMFVHAIALYASGAIANNSIWWRLPEVFTFLQTNAADELRLAYTFSLLMPTVFAISAAETLRHDGRHFGRLIAPVVVGMWLLAWPAALPADAAVRELLGVGTYVTDHYAGAGTVSVLLGLACALAWFEDGRHVDQNAETDLAATE